jgi:hypothetical protein
MDEAQFEAKYQELKQCVSETVVLLCQADQDSWVSWFAKAEAWLEAQYPSAFSQIMQAYGGMGSFNDLILDEPLEESRRRCYNLTREQLDDLQRSRS